MIATTRTSKVEVRVFLMQHDVLYDHTSYSLKEVIAFSGKLRYPFHLLGPKPQARILGALIKYYLGAFNVMENGKLDTDFAIGPKIPVV